MCQLQLHIEHSRCSCELKYTGLGCGVPKSFCSSGTKHADTTLLYESPQVTSEAALVQEIANISTARFSMVPQKSERADMEGANAT